MAIFFEIVPSTLKQRQIMEEEYNNNAWQCSLSSKQDVDEQILRI